MKRTVALVEKSSYAEIFDLLEGVDQAISPRMMCAKAITRLARAGSPRAIAAIGSGQAEVIELEVGLKEPIKLKKLGLPRGVVLGALVRDNDDELGDDVRMQLFTQGFATTSTQIEIVQTSGDPGLTLLEFVTNLII